MSPQVVTVPCLSNTTGVSCVSVDEPPHTRSRFRLAAVLDGSFSHGRTSIQPRIPSQVFIEDALSGLLYVCGSKLICTHDLYLHHYLVSQLEKLRSLVNHSNMTNRFLNSKTCDSKHRYTTIVDLRLLNLQLKLRI